MALVSSSGLTLVRLVRLLCLACPLSRLAWLGSAASVVGRGVWCQGNKAWHQPLWPCVGISLYTMWSALAPSPLNSAEMVLHFMHRMTPPPLTLVFWTAAKSSPLTLLRPVSDSDSRFSTFHLGSGCLHVLRFNVPNAHQFCDLNDDRDRCQVQG